MLTMVATVGACFVAACDPPDGERQNRGAATPEATAPSLVDALCRAASLAAGGEAGRARAVFNDAHPALHVFADRLSERDRRAASRLLVAKQEVEADLYRASPAALAEDLRALANAVDGDAADDASCS